MAQLTFSPDMIIIGLAVLWSLFLPSYPDTLFALLDGLVGVFLLLLIVVVVLPQGVVPGVLVMVAVALTFVERNRRKINRKIVMIDSAPRLEQQLAAAAPMSPLEVHPVYEQAEHDETSFYPQQNDGSDTFEPVDTSINEKAPIPVISSNTDKAERFFISQHLGKTDLD